MRGARMIASPQNISHTLLIPYRFLDFSAGPRVLDGLIALTIVECTWAGVVHSKANMSLLVLSFFKNREVGACKAAALRRPGIALKEGTPVA